MANNIRFDVDLNVRKEGLNSLKQSLQEIQKMTPRMYENLNKGISGREAYKELMDIKSAASQVEDALKKAFNVNLGTLNTSKFSQELKNLNIDNLYNKFSKLGAVGKTAFRDIVTQATTTNVQLKQTSHLLDQMATTMANTVRWGITSSIMNSFTGAVQEAYGYVQHLDASLNDIRIVTGKSADEMARFAETANDAAQKLGQGTTDYTRASLIYYQQGLQDAEVQARAETTLKAANVTGQSANAVSKQLTAVWNGYKVSAEETELYVDKLAAVAATTAADLEELSTGMSKVASAANAMGVDVDSLNAQLATIVSVTRQAPESVGTALRSIYARMSQLKADGTDEFGATLGNYTEQMKSMGIEVLDATGEMRDMGDVIDEVAVKWNGWTQAQKNAAAQTMAGTRQYNNLVALFENWDMYTDALETSQNAMGTLQKQQDIYMQSTEAHLQKVRTAFEGLADSILNANTVNTVADGATKILTVLESGIDGIGGGANLLLGIFSSIAQIFSKQISSGITTFINNLLIAEQNAAEIKTQLEGIDFFKNSESYQKDKSVQYITDMADEITRYYSVMSEEDINAANSLIKQTAEAKKLELQWKENRESALQFAKTITGLSGLSLSSLDPDKATKGYNQILQSLSQIEPLLNKAEKGANSFSAALNEINRESTEEELVKPFKSLEIAVNNTQQIIKKLKLNPETTSEVQRFQKVLKSIGIEGKASVEQFQDAWGSVNFNSQSIKTFLSDIRGITSIGKEQFNFLRDQLQLTEDDFKKLQENVKNFEDKLKAMKDTANMQSIITNVTKLAGVFGTLGYTINSVSNIYNIWHDDTLTGNQQILQTLSAVGFLLPSIIQSVVNLRSAVTGLLAANPAILLMVTTVGALASAWMAFNAAQNNERKKKERDLENNKKEFEDLKKGIDSTKTLYSEYTNLLSKYKSTGEGKDELRTKTEELCKALGIEAGALDLLGGKYDEITQKMLEQQRKKIDTARTNAEQVYTGQLGLLGNDVLEYENRPTVGNGIDYTEGREVFFDPGWITEDEKEYTEELQKSIEKYTKDTGNLKELDLSNLLFGHITNVTEEDLLPLYDALEKAQTQIRADFADNPNAYLDSEIYNAIETWLQDNSEAIETIRSAKEQIEQLDAELAGIETQLAGQDIDLTVINNVEEYENVRAHFIEELRAIYGEKGIEKTNEELKAIADEYFKGYENLTGIVLKSGARESLLESIQGDKVEVENWLDSLSEEDFNIVCSLDIDPDDTLADVQKKFDASKIKIEATVEPELLETRSLSKVKEDKSFNEIKNTEDLTGSIIDELNSSNLLTGFNEEELQEFIDKLRELPGAYDDISSALEEWQAASEFGTLAQMEYLQNLLDADNNYTEESIKNRKNQLEQQKSILLQEVDAHERNEETLQTFRENLLAEQQALMDKQVENNYLTDEEKKRLEEINEELEKNEQNLADTAAETEELNEELINISNTLSDTDWDLEIEMAGTEDLLNSCNAILSEAEKIQQAAEMIGEGFIVAADDAQSLADIYPELYENAEILADGQVKLNQDTVQTLLGYQGDLLQGDTDTALARIDNEIALLTAKKDAAEAELALAYSVAKGGVDMSKQQIENISRGRQQLTQYLMNLGMEEAEANKAVAAAMSGNMEEYDRVAGEVGGEVARNLASSLASAANSSQTNSNAMINNFVAVGRTVQAVSNAIRAMANGGSNFTGGETAGSGGTTGTTYSPTVKTGNFKGVNAQTVTASAPQVADWIDRLTTDIGAYTQGIANLNAAKSQLLANNGSAQKALSGASSGSGGKPSSDKGSGSGGGKGSKGKGKEEEEPEKLDQIESELDIYHDINIELELLNNNFDRLQKQQEKLSGKALIDNLNEQLKILEQQKQAYQSKLALQNMESSAIRSSLQQQGVQFNNDGTIANYVAALQAQENHVNNIIAKYNNMTKKQQEKYKATVDQAKADYEAFKAEMSRYDELISNEMLEARDQIQDIIDQEIEIRIDKFNMSVDLKLEVGEAQREWNEFRQNVLKDFRDVSLPDRNGTIADAKRSFADLVSYYEGPGGIGTTTAAMNTVMEQLNQINNGGWSNVYGDNKAKALEDLKEYYQESMDQLESMEDLIQDIKDDYLDMIDEAIDAFDKQVDQYEYINDLIEHDKNVIGLLYGDDAYAEMDRYYQQQRVNNNNELDFLRRRVAYAEEMMNKETDPEAREKWQKEWEDALSQLNDKVEDSVEGIIDEYGNLIGWIFDELNDKVTNGLGLDYVNEEWDLINQNADRYLDTINSRFAIQELENKYLDALDAEDSIAGQQKLNDLMNEQLAMLREKDKLTQYDVDRANMIFDLTLKQIALQNAQQNKSKMRLRRDSQGNYSYQFVSDEDEVAQAQQDLAAAQNDLYNFDKENYRNNLDDIYSIYQDFQEKLYELYADQTLTEEEREQRKALLTQQYEELINQIVAENETIRNNLKESAFADLALLYDTDVQNFVNMSQAEQDELMNSLIPAWDSGIQHMADTFAGDEGFAGVTLESFDKLNEAVKNYQTALDELQVAAGVDFDLIAQGYDQASQKAQQLLNDNQELINSYALQVSAIQEVIGQVNLLIDRYTAAKNEALAATQAAYGYWQQEQLNTANEAAVAATTPITIDNSNRLAPTTDDTKKKKKTKKTDTKKEEKKDDSKKKTSSSGGGDGKIQVGDTVTYTGGTYYSDEYGSGPTGNRGPGKKVKVTIVHSGVPYPIHVYSTDSAYGWLKQSQLSGYDTGGYTGEWGNTGKLAMLHEKELVLNKSDTANILNAVSLIRDTSGLIQSLTESVNGRVAGMLSGMGGRFSFGKDKDQLEQNVHITAEFPGVRDSQEIQDAFNNLINVASQHAFNTQR